MSLNADIVIIGGGMAGFSAAMAAAQENKKVILVEKTNQLGGNATNSNVGTICGAYYRTFSESPKLVGYKFCKDLILQLLSFSDKNKLINYHNGLFVVSYDWKFLANYLEEQLIQIGVQIMKNGEITKVIKDQNTISKIVVRQSEQLIEVNLNNIVDCSGNGIVSRLSNLEMIRSSTYQSASQVFHIKNIISDNEFSLNMGIKKAIMKLIIENNWPESFASLSIVPGSILSDYVSLKITLPDVITDAAEQKGQLSIKAKSYIDQIFPFLKKEVASLKNAEIELIFPEVGIRTQQRSFGKKILKEEEVLSCKKTNSGIAIGTWPIEEWTEKGKINMQYFEINNGYTIPADCLQSNIVTNLFFAGKNISATTKAIASARVIGTCLQTGYAAGKLASCKNDSEKEKMIISLFNELILVNE